MRMIIICTYSRVYTTAAVCNFRAVFFHSFYGLAPHIVQERYRGAMCITWGIIIGIVVFVISVLLIVWKSHFQYDYFYYKIYVSSFFDILRIPDHIYFYICLLQYIILIIPSRPLYIVTLKLMNCSNEPGKYSIFKLFILNCYMFVLG